MGSIQVVTSGSTGSALYNCADIKFSKNAKKLDSCNSTGVTVSTVKAGGSTGNSTDGAAKPDTGKSAAVALGANTIALGSVAGLAAAFAVGLGL